MKLVETLALPLRTRFRASHHVETIHYYWEGFDKVLMVINTLYPGAEAKPAVVWADLLLGTEFTEVA